MLRNVDSIQLLAQVANENYKNICSINESALINKTMQNAQSLNRTHSTFYKCNIALKSRETWPCVYYKSRLCLILIQFFKSNSIHLNWAWSERMKSHFQKEVLYCLRQPELKTYLGKCFLFLLYTEQNCFQSSPWYGHFFASSSPKVPLSQDIMKNRTSLL